MLTCANIENDRRFVPELTGLGFVGAFGGRGVTASNISGRTMRDLILATAPT